MPMDETLAIAAVDLSGRAAFAVDTKVRTRLVGDLQTELVTDFFEGFARGARANVHVKTMYGRSNHHKIEAIFKAFARRCGWHAARTGSWERCCPAPRGCCEGAAKWRALGARIVLIAFAIDVLAYALKLILPWRLFATHETFVIVGMKLGCCSACLRFWVRSFV